MQLSIKQARKAILISQGVFSERRLGQGINATLKAIEKLGYIQIDTISVVERAHHHTLWNRVRRYNLSHLNKLVEQQCIFEYWSHAAAYLPMRDYRFSLPKKYAIRNAENRYWNFQDKKVLNLVLERIKTEGPLQAKDFEHKRSAQHNGWWDWKPAKKALEQLFMEGHLMIAKRQGFQKVYDLTERVLPENIDTRAPSDSEYYRHLIQNYLLANGIGTPAQISYLRAGIKQQIQKTCNEMLEDGELLNITVNQQHYYALPNIEKLLTQPARFKRVKILSPFDNLLIQRKRTQELFGFDYQIECYVPAAKRKYGYFCLPLLWGQTFAGRMDAKIDRKTGTLDILGLHLETDKPAEFRQALQPALESFLSFNQGSTIVYTNPEYTTD